MSFLRKTLPALFLLLALCHSGSAWANTCAWVSGSTKNWSDTTAWTGCGGVAPTSADTVNVSGTGTLTIDGTSGSPSLGNDVNFTGFTGTLTHAASKELDVYGALTLVSGMTYAPSSSSTVKFKATSGTKNITSAGKRVGSWTFDGVGGTWQLQDALDPVTSAIITLTNGSLDTNNQSVGSSSGVRFSSSNTNTRALTLGTTTWKLPNNTSTVWDITDSTNMTISAASSTITSIQTSASETFEGGGGTYGTFTSTSLSTGSMIINNVPTITTLTLSATGSTSVYKIGGNMHVTGVFTANGSAVTNRAYIRSSTRGTARTITVDTTVTMTNIDLQDITGAGAASWDLSSITGGSGDMGGNSGITFTTPTDVYWVPTGGTSTGGENATARWANSDGGTAGTGRIPLPQDTAHFTSNSIDAGSRQITQNLSRIGKHVWTGVTNTPDWLKNATCEFVGDITMVSGMTNSGASAYTYSGRGSSVLTSGGLTLTNQLSIDAASGTLTQGDNLASSSSFINTSGYFSAGSYTTGFTSIQTDGGTATFGGLVTLSSTITAGNGTLIIGTGGLTGGTSMSTVGTGSVTVNGPVSISGIINGATGYPITLNANFTASGAWDAEGSLTVNNGAVLTHSGGSVTGQGVSYSRIHGGH